MGSSVQVPSTGPTAVSPTSVAALRRRIEELELDVRRLNANRTPQPTLLHQLSNAGPMSQVKDGQTLIYDATTGTYKPGTPPGGPFNVVQQWAIPGFIPLTLVIPGMFIMPPDSPATMELIGIVGTATSGSYTFSVSVFGVGTVFSGTTPVPYTPLGPIPLTLRPSNASLRVSVATGEGLNVALMFKITP